MKICYTLLATAALLLPLASCEESGRTPIEPNATKPQSSAAPRAAAPSFRGKIVARQASAAELAEAARATAAADADAATTAATTAPHDPTRPGQTLQCLSGAEGTGVPTFTGTSKRFSNRQGCELNTFGGTAGSTAAFALPVAQRISGKRLDRVEKLDFFFAGGPAVGGGPRWSIPIDENGNGNFEFGSAPTDEQFAFIDAVGCNDGDPFVGALRGEDDNTCNVTYKGTTYPNWTAFEVAFPNARIARKTQAVTFIAIDNPDQHYLVYRVNLR